MTATPSFDRDAARTFIDSTWADSIVPSITDYIRIPNKSPHFDPDWQAHGYMDAAVAHVEGWLRGQLPADATLEVVRLEGRTPVILIEIPAQGIGDSDDTVLLYGHLDKQPEMAGWRDGLGPWTPVLDGDRLYGRGGADDGYASYASLTAVNALRRQGTPHARCVILIEACEESGSFDLPPYIEALADRIGTPSLVVCLDSGAGNYEQLWCTTSLRGMVTANLRVSMLREGVHSGDASGIVPESFRVLRTILGRIEDGETGEVRIPELQAEVPAARQVQARAVAEALGRGVPDKYPFLDGVAATGDDLTDLVLARTWRPTVCVVGAEGLPALQDAGNVLRPYTAVKLSFRLPPSLPHEPAIAAIRAALTADPPYGAHVAVEEAEGATGWDAPPVAPWLERSLQSASEAVFGKPALYNGEGGSIPFMNMLGQRFPEAQFMITGVLGPGSNAHGPNEFLHIPFARGLTACVSQILADHARRAEGR